MLGILTPSQIEEVLHHHLVGRIGCHADHITYVVPISYAYDGSAVYCHTFEGLKVDLMRENPEVCFEVDSMENMANWKSVICWGTYEELSKQEEKQYCIQQLAGRALPMVSSKTMQIFPHWPFPPSDPGKVPGILFRIKLRGKTGRYEGNGMDIY